VPPVRVLVPGDEAALARFFEVHPHTTLFFQNNVRKAGLVDRGAVYQASYAAAFEAGAITALANHCWNGNVLLEAPHDLEAVACEAVRASGRTVSGILGPRAQVVAARAALGLDDAAAYMDSAEDLFALELDQLRVPAPLAHGEWRCRKPHDRELALLIAWRHDYRHHHLREAPGEALVAKCREEIERHHAEDGHFVLDRGGEPVAYAAYNAAVPSCVQIGGVWTPPPLRSQGFARAVVAGALLAARARGVSRSVLFTEEDNHPAKAAYRALGYQRVGDYGMVMFGGSEAG
jgi:ribosomal protein S18 acetylase RimI-like enzyme